MQPRGIQVELTTMNEWTICTEFLFSGIGLGVVSTGTLAILSKNWLLTRLKESIRHEYASQREQLKSRLKSDNDRLLEQLREDRAREASLRSTASATLKESRVAAFERRLSAIHELWSAILDLNDVRPSYMAIVDLVGYKRGRIGSAMEPKLMSASVLDLIPTMEVTKRVEKLRPFLVEKLYALFYAYQAIDGSALSFTVTSFQKGTEFTRWWEEEHCRHLLNTVLSQKELEQLGDQKVCQLKWTRKRIEDKILAEARAVVSGQRSAEESLEQARRIVQAAQDLEIARALNS